VVLLAVFAALLLNGTPKVNAGIDHGVSNAALVRVARRFATGSGEPHPHEIRAVATTYARAAATTDLGGDSSQDPRSRVDVLTMRGHFDGGMVKGDPSDITGTVICVMVDARTGDTVGWTLGNTMPHLAKLGHVVTLVK
jgi:hypothetical protein